MGSFYKIQIDRLDKIYYIVIALLSIKTIGFNKHYVLTVRFENQQPYVNLINIDTQKQNAIFAPTKISY